MSDQTWEDLGCLSYYSYGDGSQRYFSKEIRVLSEAYARPDGEDGYQASAIDEDYNEYTVFWEQLPDWDPQSGDESDACDWEEYSVRCNELIDGSTPPVYHHRKAPLGWTHVEGGAS